MKLDRKVRAFDLRRHDARPRYAQRLDLSREHTFQAASAA